MDRLGTLPENAANDMTSVPSETEPKTSEKSDKGVKNKDLGASAMGPTPPTTKKGSTQMELDDQGKSNQPTQMDGAHRPRSVRTSRSSQRSSSSRLSSIKGNIAALEIKIKHEAAQRRYEEELEDMELEHQRQQQEQAKVIARKRRELEAMKTKSALQQEQARLAAEDSDESQYLGSDDEDAEPPPPDLRDTEFERPTPPSARNQRQPGPNVSSTPRQPSNQSQESGAQGNLLGDLANAITASRLPIPQPPIFSGNPLEYPDWIAAYDALIENKNITAADKFYFLGMYLTGEAREAVKGLFSTRDEEGYRKAKDVLQERFGDEFVISEAFRTKLETWPKVDKAISLRRFSDFISQCQAASKHVPDLCTFNDVRTITKIAEKLPDWLNHRWRRQCQKVKNDKRRYPNFDEFAEFVYQEAQLANDPVINRDLLSSTNASFPHSDWAHPHSVKSCFAQVEELNPESEDAGHFENAEETQNNKEQTNGTKDCAYCFSKTHYLPTCPEFRHKLDIDARLQFLKSQKRCLKCLRKNHSHLKHSKCRRPHDCLICKQQHPTSLHDYYEDLINDEYYEKHERELHDEDETANITTSNHSRRQATCNRIFVHRYKVQPIQPEDGLKPLKQQQSQSSKNKARSASLKTRNNMSKLEQYLRKCKVKETPD